jgi:hypothetical protein
MRGIVICLCLIAGPAAADCVEFGDTGFVISVDGNFSLVERDGGAVLTLEPDGRAPRVISVGPVEGIEPTDTVILQNGITLEYLTDTEDAVGSGGAAAFLMGVLGSTPPLGVTCTMQGEVPDAAWCLPVLGDLRPMAEGCAKGAD